MKFLAFFALAISFAGCGSSQPTPADIKASIPPPANPAMQAEVEKANKFLDQLEALPKESRGKFMSEHQAEMNRLPVSEPSIQARLLKLTR